MPGSPGEAVSTTSLNNIKPSAFFQKQQRSFQNPSRASRKGRRVRKQMKEAKVRGWSCPRLTVRKWAQDAPGHRY